MISTASTSKTTTAITTRGFISSPQRWFKKHGDKDDPKQSKKGPDKNKVKWPDVTGIVAKRGVCKEKKIHHKQQEPNKDNGNHDGGGVSLRNNENDGLRCMEKQFFENNHKPEDETKVENEFHNEQ